jgi:hypothetical protein
MARENKIADALQVLGELGMPRAQQNDRSALCLLALLDLRRGCVKNALMERDAVSEMKENPSEPACRSRLQTAVSCCGPMAVAVNVTEKA